MSDSLQLICLPNPDGSLDYVPPANICGLHRYVRKQHGKDDEIVYMVRFIVGKSYDSQKVSEITFRKVMGAFEILNADGAR